MKETLILMTGSARYDNLIYLAKSINVNYDFYNSIFDIKWLICPDQYNGSGNLDTVKEYLATTNIDYTIIMTGKENQKNYGGSLFNKPLQTYVCENNLDNPWVYILDDDNIVHPNLYKIFDICRENGFYGNKEIITTINKWHCGHNREINKEICHLQNHNEFIQEWFLFDPSSVIIRYNVIRKYGYIDDDFLYDFNWLNLKVIRYEQDNIIWFNEYEHSYGRHVVGTYHNGLVKKENLHEFLESNIDNLNMDVLLANIDIECPQNIPVLSNATKREILKLIYNDLK